MGPHPEDRGVRQPLSQPSWHGGGGKRGPSVVTMGRASRRAEEPRTAPSAPGNARTSLVLRRQPLVLRRRASFRAAEPRSAPSAPRLAQPSLVLRSRASFCAVSPSSCAAERRSAQPSVVLRRQPLVPRRRASSRAILPSYCAAEPRTAFPALVPTGRAWYRPPAPRINRWSVRPRDPPSAGRRSPPQRGPKETFTRGAPTFPADARRTAPTSGQHRELSRESTTPGESSPRDVSVVRGVPARPRGEGGPSPRSRRRAPGTNRKGDREQIDGPGVESL